MPDSENLFIQGRGPNRQNAGHGSAWVQDMGVYAKRVEIRTVGAITTIYKAWAEYGTANSATSWMVAKVTLDATTELDVIEGIAGGVANVFNFTWDDRASHSYS